jgi:hypothetical protein
MNPVFKKFKQGLFVLGSASLLLFCMLSTNSCKKEIQYPLITGFSPTQGIAGTAVTITGVNFNPAAASNNVKFNGINATVTLVTSELLTVIVPNGAATGKITLTINGHTAVSEADFIIFESPLINSISPSSGFPGTSITITGNNFSTTLSDNIVKFNSLDATVTAATSRSLTVTVPANAITGKISVTVHGMTTISANDFVIPPTIESFSPSSGLIGSNVVIYGTGFSNTSTNNVVKFVDKIATIVSATTTSLTVTVPSGAITGKISVDVGGHTAISSSDFVIKVSGIELVTDGGSGYDVGYSVKFDGFGNTYVTGSFQGTAYFGNIQVNSAGSSDIFLAKYNPNYDLIWVRTLKSTNSSGSKEIAVDLAGNVYMTGTFIGITSFGNISLTEAGGIDGFITKFDTDGNAVWAKQISSGGYDAGYSIKLDASGSPYVTGAFSNTASFGTTSLTSDGGNDIFIAKYNASNGDLIWAKKFGGTNDQTGNDIGITASGNIYLAGSFFITANFGAHTLSAVGGLDGFVAKLNSTGDIVWVKQIPGTNWDNALSIALDGSENCYVAGYFGGTTNFGGSILTSLGHEDIFLAQYSLNGDLIWVKTAGSNNSYSNAKSVTTDAIGNIYITGHFTGTTIFQDKTLTSNDIGGDIFTAKYNSQGNLLWVKKAGGADTDRANSVAVNGSGIVTVCGFFRGTGTSIFGTTSIIGSGNDDIFLWRIFQ